ACSAGRASCPRKRKPAFSSLFPCCSARSAPRPRFLARQTARAGITAVDKFSSGELMNMQASIEQILSSYDDRAPLSSASTIPAAWYTDPRIAELERLNVFSKTWQLVARTDQLQNAGDFVTTRLAGEPIVVVRGSDGDLRAFFNVCRHHAAAVVTQSCGRASILQCPYHGWKYGLDGSLKGMPEFEGVENFERA